MKQTAFLDYAFLFDPSETWSNLIQFEADLIKFFESNGVEAHVLKPVEGQFGRRILVLNRKPTIKLPTDTTKAKKVIRVPEKDRPINQKEVK